MSTPFRKEVTFDPGRVVWGAPGKTIDKDRKTGKPLTDKQGKPRIKCDFGVAIPKNGTTSFWQTTWGAALYQVALASFPNLFDPTTRALLPGRKFSFKVTDGDSDVPNENGRKPCEQEGYPGCWVVAFGSQFVPRCVRWDNGAWVDIDPALIKTGHEVQVAGSVDSNGDAQKSGVFVNHGLVSHTNASLPEIISTGVDPSAAGLKQQHIGGSAPAGALPGSQPAPAAGLPAAGPLPGGPLPGAGPAPAATLPAAGPGGPPTAVVPNTGILNTGAPAAPAAPAPDAPAAPPAGPTMTAKAGGVSYEAYRAKNWTDDQLRAHGLMV